MVDGGDGGVPFPVVFLDGQREISVGTVKIHSSLRFKNFQSVLSQMIGASPNQISIYLVDRKRSKSAPEQQRRRRIPITGKANFAVIARERECSVLVVLKQRRSRRAARRVNSEPPSPEKLLLLRRNHADSNDSSAAGFQFGDYLKLNLNSNFEIEAFPRIEDIYSNSNDRVLCDVCTKAKRNRKTATFHWCIYDAVTVGFRSPAGPIARPLKASS